VAGHRDGFFVAPRQSRVLVPLVLPSGVHVEFKQVILVCRAEAADKTAYGLPALVARWRELRVPFWDVTRAEVALG
jgi:hypothetical protein